MIIIGGDPGATCGIVAVQFPDAETPHWRGARLLFTEVIHKPTRTTITAAENDVEYSRKIAAAVREHPEAVLAKFVALEEPLDGGKVYSTNPSQGQTGQRRDTAFRLGVHYAALLRGVDAATECPRIISFPAKSQRGSIARRGWMPPRGTRETAMAASNNILRAITTLAEFTKLPRDKDGNIVEHVLMAVGVVNHLLEYFTDYFPPPKTK
jgi:hypothetical protein